MSFWDKAIKGIAEVGKKAAASNQDEARAAAQEVVNQLPKRRQETAEETRSRRSVVSNRPASTTKGRLERDDSERSGKTFKVSDSRKARANEIAYDVSDNVERLKEENREQAQNPGDLMPSVKSDDGHIDELYDHALERAAKSGRSLGDDPSMYETVDKFTEARIEKQRREAKREAYEKKQDEYGKSVVVESDEPDYMWDEDAGIFVDNRSKETLDSPISYEQDLARRSREGEDFMYVPKKGQWIDAGDGRVHDGQTHNEYGDNVLMSHITSGDWSKGHAAAGYEEGEMAPVLADVLNGLSDGLTSVDSSLRNARADLAESNADWNFRTTNGTLYDFDDTRDMFETDEFRDFYDGYLSSDRKVTMSRPSDMRTTDKMYSGGSFYVEMRDSNGNVVYGDDGQPVTVKVGSFDGSSEFDDAGNPIPSGSLDEVTGMWVMPNGNYIPTSIGDDGQIYPQITYVWDAETDDDGEAIAWNEPYESFSMDGRGEIPIADVVEILNGEAERENLNSGPLNMFRTPEEMSVFNDEGHLDAGKLAENFVPMFIDGSLSSIPYMLNPKLSALMTANNIAQAMRGLDPYTYDAETGTYEMPSTMSRDQYAGHVASVSMETLLDSLAGLGKTSGLNNVVKNFFKGVAREFVPETEKSVARQARREAARLARPYPVRVAREAAGESVAEMVPEFFSPLERGDYVDTYFASQQRDEDGNLVWDPAGNPVWDTDTPVGERTLNALDALIPSGILGGAQGGALGGVAGIGQYRRDRELVKARDGYIPVDRRTIVAPGVMTEGERKAAEDWYERQQETDNG